MFQRYVLKLRDATTPAFVNSISDTGVLIVTERIGGSPEAKGKDRATLFLTEQAAWDVYEIYKTIPLPPGYQHTRLQAVPVNQPKTA